MTRWQLRAALLAAWLPAVAPAAPPDPTSSLAGVVFEDQYERRNDVTSYRGDVVVLLYGDRKGATANQALGQKLFLEFHPAAAGLPPEQAARMPARALSGQRPGAYAPNVHVIPVASLGSVPSLIRPVIRNQFCKGSPNVAVWLDFDDHLKNRFGLAPSTVNLVVLDAVGRPRFKVAGEPTAQDYPKIVQVIESLRAEAISPTGMPPVLKAPPEAIPMPAGQPQAAPEGPTLPPLPGLPK